MSEGGSGTTAEDLDAIEREVAACREELRDLESRTRVMEVEARAWEMPSAPPARPEGGTLVGILCGFFGMVVLGTLIGRFLAWVR